MTGYYFKWSLICLKYSNFIISKTTDQADLNIRNQEV